MPFEIVKKDEHTDDKHGLDYSAKHTITNECKHPKGYLFKHVHEDGKDYEDSYRYETVTIGDFEIKYSYDWGNYFIWEYVMISVKGKEVSRAEQEYGAVDPLKTKTDHKEEGKYS